METERCKNFQFLCYVCGHYTPKSGKGKQLKIAKCPTLIKAYELKYGPILINVSYAPDFVCKDCSSALRETRHYRKVPVTPTIWNKPNKDHTNCYACLLPDLSLMTIRRWNLVYPDNVNSSVVPAVYEEREKPPKRVKLRNIDSESEEEEYTAPVTRRPKKGLNYAEED